MFNTHTLETALVHDVVLKLMAKMLEHALHRHGRRIAQGADRSTRNIGRQGIQKRQVALLALTVLDPLDHSPQPTRALATRRALPT